MDTVSDSLPKGYAALRNLQREFEGYQKAGFPERPSHFFCLELCGEAGELANLEKKSWKGKAIEHERFEDEAADVLIALMNYANAKGVDLAQAVETKMGVIDQKRAEGTH